MSKIRDKWAGEFDSLTNFYEENIRAWTIDYLNFNNNISIIVNEAHKEVLEIEKEISEMKSKHEITVPPLWDFISEWLEKQLPKLTNSGSYGSSYYSCYCPTVFISYMRSMSQKIKQERDLSIPLL